VSEQKKIKAWGSREIIVLAFLASIFGLLAIIAAPNFLHSCCTSEADTCINILAQIEGAANQFALEHNLTNGARINFPDDLTPYTKLNRAGKIPGCPSGGIYRISKVGDKPTCSLGTTVTPAHVLP
jgi:hypothetical protein